MGLSATERMRRWRKNNPMNAAYNNLKNNAKRRGKPFELTFEQFKQFAIKTEYIAKKGISATSYTIDRINEELGYTIDNIQVLQNSDNIKKYKRFRLGELGQPEFRIETVKSPDVSNCPF